MSDISEILAVYPGGLRLKSALGQAMTAFINSEPAREAALAAVLAKRPPLEAIDPLLQAAFGEKYTTTYEATVQAGYITSLMMQELGYTRAGDNQLNTTCFAKSGATFVKL